MSKEKATKSLPEENEYQGSPCKWIPDAAVRFKLSGEEGIIKSILGFDVLVEIDQGRQIKTQLKYLELIDEPQEPLLGQLIDKLNSKLKHVVPVDVQFSKEGPTFEEALANVPKQPLTKVMTGETNGHQFLDYSKN